MVFLLWIGLQADSQIDGNGFDLLDGGRVIGRPAIKAVGVKAFEYEFCFGRQGNGLITLTP
jgi:hypothetical protein